VSRVKKVQIWIDIYGKPEPSGGGKPTNVNTSPAGEVSKPKSYSDVARELNVGSMTVSRVAEVQDDEELKLQLREGEIEATAAQRAVKQKIANDNLRKFKEREEGKVPETWQGLYALAPKANMITQRLSEVINGVDRWLSNEYGLDRIDPQGHTPLLITKTEQAIRALTKFKQALEELKNEHK
jgi:hypothetical protein